MAINSFEITSNKSQPYSFLSKEHLNPSRLMKIDFAKNDRVASSVNKRGKLKQNNNFKSPYLSGDSVHLLSRVTEKRFIHKRATDFVSSFPLALNIYRTNSDEFKTLKRGRKKIKKSVLTLPNEPAPMPQTCTVSDMNDSEYCSREGDNCISNLKQRLPNQRKKKIQRNNKKSTEFYDRDARYCSQLNIDLDCSSTDVIETFKRSGINRQNKLKVQKKPQSDYKFNAHNVWAALRNMKRFQFNLSPPMSEDSTVSSRKKKEFNKRRKHQKNTGYVETCRTEEFAYISSIDIDNKSPTSFSQTSSFDRITVIDKEDGFNGACQEFERRATESVNITKTKNVKRRNVPCDNLFTKKPLENNNNAKDYKNQLTIPTTDCENCSRVPCSRNKDKIKRKLLPNENKQFFILSNANSQNSNGSQLLFINSKENENGGKFNYSEANVNVATTNDKFVGSVTSGSSKVALECNLLKDKEKSLKTSPNISKTQINGITKVVLKGQDINISKRNLELTKRKPRLVTTMPSTETNSKLTHSDIKRKLAQIKFPLVILGKDEISSTIKVVDYEPPQFNGLDNHIWPFMLNWANDICNNKDNLDNKAISNDTSLKEKVNAKRTSRIESNKKVIRKLNNISFKNPSLNKVHEIQNSEDIKLVRSSKALNKKKEQKRIRADSNNLNEPESQTLNQNSIHRFKDKMLKLLYRKSSRADFKKSCPKFEKSNLKDAIDVSKKAVNAPKYIDASTETCKQGDEITKNLKSGSLLTLNKKLTTMKYPWAKGKYASDFIDNVIRKIKDGVYYTHERKYLNSWITNEFKDVSVQTSVKSIASNKNHHCIELSSTKIKNDPLKIVFGSDDTLPLLEIVTMNANQIAVKHCMKNVIINFDVAMPVESSTALVHLKNSFSFVPVMGTDSQTKVFKCKTTIVNAMLPSELCSMLPKMINDLRNFKARQAPLPVIDKIDSNLSTITELSRCESPDLFKSVPPNVYTSFNISVEGKFSNILSLNLSRSKYQIVNRIVIHSDEFIKRNSLLTELLPKLRCQLLFLADLWKSNLNIISSKYFNNRLCKTRVNKEMIKQNDTFSGHSSKPARNNEIIPVVKSYDFSSITVENLKHRSMRFDIRKISYVQSVSFSCRPNNITLNMIIANVQDDNKEILTLSFNNLKMGSHLNAFSSGYAVEADIFEIKDDKDRCIEYTNDIHKNKMEKKECTHYQPIVINKFKKKGFVKLYRKCKSTSNISGERCSTALSKITNLDEVFQAIGSGKMLASMFDGNRGNSILSSLAEMKNWITEITPRQVMLVILLINKKDTPNLIRFRPLILQGIAVNRITRVSELDMEIEVIERETFNGLSQYEGISYLPASIENRDNLLEELYWIAKTTASDYQRPFDESSERLLRSLLEKRKKLNPSYLRVMARYVGLGLLKSPNKN